jgi:multiple sugar transport system substrate-binding protein
MMISHPSEYAVILDRAKKATGDDRKTADAVVENMRYGLIPKGSTRRAVVFGGSNAHVFKPDIVEGGMDLQAARAFIAFMTGPEWSIKMAWVSSNPGNIRGFRTKWMRERHSVPGAAAIGRDHEHHRAQHAAKRAHRQNDGGCRGRHRRQTD